LAIFAVKSFGYLSDLCSNCYSGGGPGPLCAAWVSTRMAAAASRGIRRLGTPAVRIRRFSRRLVRVLGAHVFATAREFPQTPETKRPSLPS